MDFIEVIQANQLPAGTMKSITSNGDDILLVNYKGKYYAIGTSCTHSGADLSKGKLKGKYIDCPLHGSRFDVTTGICKAGPRINIFRSKIDNIPTYPVKVEGNSIKVSINQAK
ncbi:Rieske (2Fe-2S) protein [Chloroflexota bacterium]